MLLGAPSVWVKQAIGARTMAAPIWPMPACLCAMPVGVAADDKGESHFTDVEVDFFEAYTESARRRVDIIKRVREEAGRGAASGFGGPAST